MSAGGLTDADSARMLSPSSASAMNQSRPVVLVVDDDESFGRMLAELLLERGFAAAWLSDPDEVERRVSREPVAVAVVDLIMPAVGGLSLVDRLRAVAPDTQFLILTGHGSLDTAVESLRHGVFDYLRKSDLNIGLLEQRVRQAVERSLLARENRELVLRLETLSASSAALADEPQPGRLLDQAVATARGLCGAAAARALLFQRETSGAWRVTSAAGDGAAGLVGLSLAEGQGLARLVAEGEAPLLADRPQEQPGYSALTDELGTTLPGLIVAPLRHRGVLGVLMVAGARRKPFGAGEREALVTLGRQAAVALDNAQLHARAAHGAREEQLAPEKAGPA